MSWPMASSGQWNPGMGMAPEMMGSYTPEQWVAMQQQNWQQWTQWQQQYAQWQSQYGEKYTEQMQAIQAMGGMPPLPPPNTAPPPAPPPPDKPPPPPHENNQPLFGQTSSQPAPVPAPSASQHRSQISGNNINISTTIQAGNNPNWQYGQEPSISSVNAEALKKLAEEERLFDIQFQKWEEEIEKWKSDNVNHPDKQAYKDYEEKFEACRAQLLERRQQMNKKKARLLSAAPPLPPPQPPNPTSLANTNNTIAPSSNNIHSNAYPTKQQQHYGNIATPNLNKPPPPYGNNSAQNYLEPSNAQYQYQQFNTPQNQNAFKRNNNNINMDPQDRFNAYSHAEKYTPKDKLTAPPVNPSFLLASESNKKGIPGLDLVPDADKSYVSNVKQDVIDITGDKPQGLQSKAPDYSTISKGINNILGDEKIMNILSMVRGQVGSDSISSTPTNQSNISGQFDGNSQSNSPFDQGYRNQKYNNQQYDNRQNNMPFNRQGGNYSLQNQEGPRHGPPQKRMIEERQNDMLHEQYDNYERNKQYSGNDGGSYDNDRGGPPLGRANISGPRPLMETHLQEMPGQNTINDFSRAPPSLPHDYTRGPSGIGQQNDFNRGPPGPGQQTVNDYTRGPPGPPGPSSHLGPLERRQMHESNINSATNPLQPPRPKWIDEPMFSPSLIVEYEHKPLRLKARDFIEPVHMFDYNHKSKDGDKKKDFEKEVDDLFLKKPRRGDTERDYTLDRYNRDYYSRDFERRAPKDDLRDEIRTRIPLRDEFDDRRRLEDDKRRMDEDRRRLDDDRRRLDRYDDRRRDDRDKYGRRDDSYRDRDRDYHRDRDRGRDLRREDVRYRSRSRERDSRKRGLSRDSEFSDSYSKRSREKDNMPAVHFDQPKHVVMIDDLLELPGREMRPEKIVIILRGPPGSGKSYLAKLIRDKEAEHGGTVRIMSIDDYFMQEGEIEEKDPGTGKLVKKPTLKYEYDEASEEAYLSSLKRAFKRSLTDGFFTFIIYDANNETLRSYGDVWNLSRQNDFQVYVCTMELDPQICFKRNIHNRTLSDIETICARFYPTPPHHIQLDATTLLQSGAITEVQMEDADVEVISDDTQEHEVESVFTSKWEKMDDAAQLARLDGTNKPLRPSQLSMEDYLQLDDWKPTTAKPGKKTVRWADIEERREQEKMRAIGFVVGQTDWNRMTDPTMGSSALTQTKYIERVRRN